MPAVRRNGAALMSDNELREAEELVRDALENGGVLDLAILVPIMDEYDRRGAIEKRALDVLNGDVWITDGQTDTAEYILGES